MADVTKMNNVSWNITPKQQLTGTLAAAYGTPGVPGADGITPHICENGNWWIGDTDTGNPSRGIQGEPGRDGIDGYTPQKNIDYFDGKDGADGKDGVDGFSPSVDIQNINDGYRITIVDKDGTNTFDVLDGKSGADGNGIKYTVLNSDYTLTLTFDDGTTYTTPSIRGEDGYTPVKGVDYFDGEKGEPGKDGYTPIKGVDYFDGVSGKDGADGYTPQKNVDYFDGKDGVDGKDGSDGKDGVDGKDGSDGFSPSVVVEDIDGGHRVTIIDKDGEKTFDVMDGQDGVEGSGSGIYVQDEAPTDAQEGALWLDVDEDAAVGGGSGGSGGSGGFIDVLELPTKNIDKNATYRLLTATFIMSGEAVANAKCYCVNGLPEAGEPCTNASASTILAYYNTADGECYGYVDSMLSLALSVPVGWYDAYTLCSALGYDYGGVVWSATTLGRDAICLLLAKNNYVFDGVWTNIHSKKIVPSVDVSWDGETGGRDTLTFTVDDASAFLVGGTHTLYKVSEVTPSEYQYYANLGQIKLASIDGYTDVLPTYDGNSVVRPVSNQLLYASVMRNAYSSVPAVCVVLSPGTHTVGDCTVDAPSAGLYFWKSETAHVTNLSLPHEVITGVTPVFEDAIYLYNSKRTKRFKLTVDDNGTISATEV